MIERSKYIDQLSKLKDLNVIKVITGIRRSGKSVTMWQFRNKLESEYNVSPDQILYYDLDDKLNEVYTKDKDALHSDVLARIDSDAKYYVFIDEVQKIPEFERTIDSLYIRRNIDLYITGSNAFITSSELGTFLSGRYVEVKMQPLSFSEYIKFFPETTSKEELFSQYLLYGGFPEVANFLVAGAKDQVPLYLKSIYETIIEEDIRTHKGIVELEDFRNTTKFLFDNIGKPSSSNSISEASRTKAGAKIPQKKIQSYLEALTDCYVFSAVNRYDIRGKKLLKTQKKYYAVDLGLADAVLDRPSSADYGRRLENVIYLELKRRYSDVYIGKNFNKEIDFVVKDADRNTVYYQVAWTVANESTLVRELTPLKNTGDNHQKILLTTDTIPTSENGIIKDNVISWLLED